MKLSYLFVALIVSAFAAVASGSAATVGTFDGTIKSIAPGKASVTVTVADFPKLPPLSIASAALQAQLAPAQPGDEIHFQADDATAPKTIVGVTSLSRPISPVSAFGVLALSVGILVVISAVLLRGSNPFVGLDNRLSNSQTQMGLWFAAVAVVYLAANILRGSELGGGYIGGVSLPTNLILLTGLSAFTFGAARAITTQKAADAPNAKPDAAAPAPAAVNPGTPNMKDLVQNNSQKADLGDLQMILVTLAAVTIFVCQSFWYLTSLQISKTVVLPDVDSALLATFGLGQGAYLFKKAASPFGAG